MCIEPNDLICVADYNEEGIIERVIKGFVLSVTYDNKENKVTVFDDSSHIYFFDGETFIAKRQTLDKGHFKLLEVFRRTSMTAFERVYVAE